MSLYPRVSQNNEERSDLPLAIGTIVFFITFAIMLEGPEVARWWKDRPIRRQLEREKRR